MSNKEGRVLGLVGGLGPNATVYYYNGLIAAHKAQGRVARMLIAHADVDHGRPLAEAGKLDELARYLNGFIEQTAAGGAEMAAIVAITPHICTAQLLPLLRIPLIDMVSVVADEVSARGLKRVALLGTRSTVESRMFGRLGVDVVMPTRGEIDFIHNAYLDVVYDRSTPAGIDRLRELARTLIRRDGAEAVLLAGTDLSMAMNEDNAGFPTLDCAGVHIAAITRRLLG
ncbi:MAG: aspartate racemase [Hyphomicrobiales bacterium]|jgi:aspartate racemase|nr:aspartate racemase [Hyphomicrobiales bacterium]